MRRLRWRILPVRLRLPRLYLPQPRRLVWPGEGFGLRGFALLLAFVLLFAGICSLLERRAAPQIRALTKTAALQQANIAVTAAVEEVLVQQQVTYERLVRYTEEGGLRSIQTNALEANLLRAQITEAVEKAVTMRRGRLRLPLGALLGSSLFAGAGPKISVPLAMTGHALSDIRSDLTSAGVNQTMHRVLMDLRVSISVILPGGAEESELALTVCLAETVIIGAVPNGIITQK